MTGWNILFIVGKQSIKPTKVGLQDSVEIFHFHFADDASYFRDASLEQPKILLATVSYFVAASNIGMNIQKSLSDGVEASDDIIPILDFMGCH